MRLFALIILLGMGITPSLFAQDTSSIWIRFDSFFQSAVTGSEVNYAALHKSSGTLTQLVEDLKQSDLLPSDSISQKAFWINTYNVLVIHQVVEHYPVASVREVNGFFEQKKFTVAGKRYSLNDIENEVLRKEFFDPRLHFVLVCGALSCPPIINSAYFPEKLNEQLDRQTRLALNRTDFIRLDSEHQSVGLSMIFQWYKKDFTATAPSLVDYINSYRKSKLPGAYDTYFYEYDWSLNGTAQASNKEEGTLNLQTYTPSVLLRKGQWEFKSFQNLYTQIGGYNDESQYTDYGGRSTFFTSINQFTYGINPRFNVGLDLWLKSVLYHDSEDWPTDIFQFQNTPQSRTALSGLGPRIRVNPIKKWSHFAAQTTFLIPLANNQDGGGDPNSPWLSNDAYLWTVRLNYDQSMGSSFQWFFQVASWYTIPKAGESSEHKLELPADIFLSWFPNKRFSIYAQNQFWPTFKQDGTPSGFFLQGGLGAKYQLVPGVVELETSYTNFYYGRNAGAGQTFNLGIRILGG